MESSVKILTQWDSWHSFKLRLNPCNFLDLSMKLFCHSIEIFLIVLFWDFFPSFPIQASYFLVASNQSSSQILTHLPSELRKIGQVLPPVSKSNALEISLQKVIL